MNGHDGRGCGMLANPIGYESIRVGHPGADAPKVSRGLTTRQSLKVGCIHVHAGEVGGYQLVGQRLAVEELLKEGATVVRPLAVPRKDDWASVVPFGQIGFKRPAKVSICHRGRRVAQAVPQRENTDVGLPVSWRKHPASMGKCGGLMLNGPLVNLFIHGLVVDVGVPLWSFHVHGWMEEEDVCFAIRQRLQSGTALGYGQHVVFERVACPMD